MKFLVGEKYKPYGIYRMREANGETCFRQKIVNKLAKRVFSLTSLGRKDMPKR